MIFEQSDNRDYIHSDIRLYITSYCDSDHILDDHVIYSSFLSRCGIVFHGGIDGFSRVIAYLHASTDNTAQTLLNHFKGAVAQYGLPLLFVSAVTEVDVAA